MVMKRCLCTLGSHAPKQLKIGIIGGSMAGLFSGVSLQSLGFDIKIFERGTNAKIGAGYVVTPPLMEFLEKFKIIDSANFDSNFFKSYESAIIYDDNSIEMKSHDAQYRLQTTWDFLYSSTLNKLINHQNNMEFNKKMVDIKDNGVNNMMTIYFEDNTTFECDLVIGCDGLGSETRSYIKMNNDNTMHYGGYNLWRGVVESSKIDQQSTLYSMRKGNKLIVYNGQNTQFLCFMVPNYYNQHDALYNWAWYICYDYDKDLKNDILIDRNNYHHRYSIQRGDVRDEVCLKLQQYAKQTLPSSLSELVSMTNDPFCQIVFDYRTQSMMQYFEKREQDKQGGIVLVGDSAFILRPHTSRGVSKAAADTMCLYENLKKYKNNELSLYDAMSEFNAERLKIGNEAADIGIELAKKLLSFDNSDEKKQWKGSYIRSATGPHVTVNI